MYILVNFQDERYRLYLENHIGNGLNSILKMWFSLIMGTGLWINVMGLILEDFVYDKILIISRLFK